MKTKRNGIEPTRDEALKVGKVKCSTCGRELKFPRDWIKGDNGIIICGFCYQNFLYPIINDSYMEKFD